MKPRLVTLLALAAALILMGSAAQADDITVTVIAFSGPSSVITPGLAAAAAAAVPAGSIILENFNSTPLCGGSGTGLCAASLPFASVGTFGLGGGNLAGTGSGNHNASLSILDAATTPFAGRYDVPTNGVVNADGRWLDSNDNTDVLWTLGGKAAGLSNVFFFMNDINDVNGSLTVKTADGSTETFAMAPTAKSGGLYFVMIQTDGAPIASVEFLNTSRNDGWGIDSIGTVPEPGSLVLLGSGLLGLAGTIRRRLHR